MNLKTPEDEFIRANLGKAFDGIAVALCDWLHGQLLRHGGKKWWEHHVCSILHEVQQGRIADGEWTEIADLDLHALLGVLTRNFNFLKSHRSLKKEDREVIRAMMEARNRCVGHRPVGGIPLQELPIHADTMKAFCRLIGASKSLTGEIDALGRKISEHEVEKPSVSAVSENRIYSAQAANGQMSLAEFFGDEALTASQKEAVDALQLFLDDPAERCFILNGFAGTGKTFLIGGLVRYLRYLHRAPEMMAPTGRAAHVLRDRHQVEASTIHRHIYSLASLKEYREIDEQGDVTFKFYFDLKNNDVEHDSVFIVDEASMISDVHSESEFMHFGSGRLLSDLIRYINFDANEYRKKLILVGDNAQLPPVGMKFSPALEVDYLRKKCLVSSRVVELTDVVRQRESSPILKNATRMRELLRSDRFPSFEFASDGREIRELTPGEFVESFVQNWGEGGSDRSVIVAYTNSSTRTYNEAVRKRLFPDVPSLTDGDQIIVVKNNYRYERSLLNGQMGRVVAAGEQVESRKVPLNVGSDGAGKRKTEIIDLQFRDATLQFADDRGGFFEITCKVFEHCLHNGEANIPSEYTKALYVDFRKRNSHLSPKDPEFKEALKADSYFNAVMLKFGYAITCHKAQGGEWHTVYIDFSGKNKLNADGLRWSYTALTRAEECVVATNALHHGVLKAKKSHSPPAEASVSAVAPMEIDGETEAGPDVETDENHAPNNPPPPPTSSPQEAIRQRVDSMLPDGWTISAVRSMSYQERFTFAVGAASIVASLYYKSSNRISKVQVKPNPGQPELAEQAMGLLAPLKGQFLFGDPEAASVVRQPHEEFVNNLKRELADKPVEILSVESKSEYHLMARLRTDGVEGDINYFFDKVGAFTRFTPHPAAPEQLIAQLTKIHG